MHQDYYRQSNITVSGKKKIWNLYKGEKGTNSIIEKNNNELSAWILK